MNDSIKGIRTALQAAPETAEGQTEDAQDGDADTPHDENAASAGTGTGQDASVVEKAVDAVADDDTDEVGYLLAVQVHRFASLMPLGVHAKTKPRVRLHVLARMHACARTLSRHIMVLKCTDVGSAGDVVRLYAPPRPAEDAAAEDQGKQPGAYICDWLSGLAGVQPGRGPPAIFGLALDGSAVPVCEEGWGRLRLQWFHKKTPLQTSIAIDQVRSVLGCSHPANRRAAAMRERG